MARPTSKYFASVITKFIEAKQRENIIIDESFKASLRQDIVNRAAGIGYVDDKSTEGGFFRRWRYALALVPSALVVMVVAAQFMNMPVDIKSEQVVPVGGPSVESAKDLQTNIMDEDDEVVDLSEYTDLPKTSLTSKVSKDSNAPKSSKLKTFPGALVMPSGISHDEPTASVDSEKVVSYSDLVKEDDDNVVSSTYLPSQSIIPAEFFEYSDSYEESYVGDESSDEDGKGRDDGVLTKVADYSGEPDDSSEPESLQKEESLPQDDSQEEKFVESATPEGGQESLQNEETQEMILEEKVEQILPISGEEEIVTQYAALDVGEDWLDMDFLDALPDAEVVNLYMIEYRDVILSDFAKDALEESLVPDMAQGREVDSVEVTHCEDVEGTLVHVEYVDGSVEEECVQYNSDTDEWDNVERVFIQYYDGGLSYRTRIKYDLR